MAQPPQGIHPLVKGISALWAAAIVAGAGYGEHNGIGHQSPSLKDILSGLGFHNYADLAVTVQIVTAAIVLVCLLMFFDARWNQFQTIINVRTILLDLAILISVSYCALLAGSDIERFRLFMLLSAFLWLLRLGLGVILAKGEAMAPERALFGTLIIRYGLLWSLVTTFPALYQLGERAFPEYFTYKYSQAVLDAVLLFAPLFIGFWGLSRLDFDRVKEILRQASTRP